jgi:hypothetical protein
MSARVAAMRTPSAPAAAAAQAIGWGFARAGTPDPLWWPGAAEPPMQASTDSRLLALLVQTNVNKWAYMSYVLLFFFAFFFMAWATLSLKRYRK